MKVRDRIKELRRVKASELIPNAKNWRTHPTRQRDALKGVLAEVGYADALLAYETDAGLCLIDGHLRAETTPDMLVPVLILDVDEAEANKLLASLDPLAALAGTDGHQLQSLLNEVQTSSEELAGMFTSLLEKSGIIGKEAYESRLLDEPVDLTQYKIMIDCETEEQQRELLEKLTGEGLNCRGVVL